ncbi:MAG: TonB family protein [Chlorobium sp.]|uniref:energy transducer TonB n=1 Tax=Chlorobium sp. TaxID=1095 RepID=UPI0025BA4E25|nr:energy transducer TonB [Chlorobium sp.]MCF8215255.1 TonB family protein [Chlorobium sp.]MCF8270090.1 TonB family protein [Chlorobium sp.]MCF8286461.1 TonB family protein [Chlorobium sp.]MCF8290059.1 TonB family protein [Chlorobium sp.]MCF8384130.1 TonB family protein [Chlorobium sp.]
MSSNFDNIHRKASRKVAVWSFVEEFLDTDRLRSINYGNLVLRRQSHLFLTHGVMTAIVMLGIFWLVSANWNAIRSFGGFSSNDDAPKLECYEMVRNVTQLPPPPPIAPPPPAIVTPAAAKPAPPNVGKIKTVKEAEAPLQQTLATQKEIKQAIQTQASAGTGSGTGASVSDEVPMFVPCEKMPGFLDQKKPAYPEMARTAGIEGRVFVSVLIGEDGRPLKARVMKRVPADCTVFDAVAIKSVMESRYYPGIQNGSPIKVWFTVPIRFQLD